MRVFKNAVRGFSLVLRNPGGSHYKSWWRKIDKTEPEIPVVRGESFHEFLVYQLRNLDRVLTFICYAC